MGVGKFPSINVRQCGIHLPGKSRFIQVFSKSYCEIIGDFYYGNDHSFIKISTLASESGRLIFLDKRPILFASGPQYVIVISMNKYLLSDF